MITPAQQHWQNVMAQRAGRANEGVDHAARTAHEEVLYRLRLVQARLKGVQARSAKAAIKKELLPDFSGWIEGTLEADGGQQDEVIATLMVWAIDCGDLPLALRIPFSQRRRTAPPAYYLSAKPKRGTDTVRHNVLAVLPVDVVQQVDFPQRAIVNAQLVVGVFDSVSV